MSGSEVSLLRQSGGNVKILRRANDEEVAAYTKEQNGHIAQQPQERHSDNFDGCDDYDMEGDLS